jgi:Lambda phage tail tube protein, TTP
MADMTDTFYPAEGIHGYGTQWLIGMGDVTPGPETFEAVPYVKRITPGDMTTEVMDKTHLRSPEAHREKKAGLRDSGPFAIEMIYHPKHESQSNAGGGTGVYANGGIFWMWRTRKEQNMKLILPDGDPTASPAPIEATELPFRGVITKCQVGEIGEDAVIPLMVEVTPLQDFSAGLP